MIVNSKNFEQCQQVSCKKAQPKVKEAAVKEPEEKVELSSQAKTSKTSKPPKKSEKKETKTAKKPSRTMKSSRTASSKGSSGTSGSMPDYDYSGIPHFMEDRGNDRGGTPGAFMEPGPPIPHFYEGNPSRNESYYSPYFDEGGSVSGFLG
jgi:hypothetical protein